MVSTDLKQDLGWSSARLRGIKGALARRVEGAVGRKNGAFVDRRWLSEEGENEYSLPENVRDALAGELGW